MKTKLLNSVLLIMALMAALPASAYDFMVDGLCYNFNGDGTSVTVTYERTSSPRYTSLNGAITIPETVTYSGTTYSVTSIGDEAFAGCYGLTSVTIPNSVTTIGNHAFSNCSGLTSVTIPNSVTSIGVGAFTYCSGLTSVTIPNSVTTIGDYAFRGCSGLTSIVVAQGNTVYDSRNNCNAIIETASNTLIVGCQNTVIPNSVTTIGDLAFYGCSGLTSVTIPGSVTSIGENAFWDCSGLTSVTIPNSVTTIGNCAFENCSGLTSVTIPNSVISIGDYAFRGCSGLTSIVVAQGNTVYDSRNNCNAIIKTASNTLFVGCQNTVIPNSVTSIGCYAFFRCSGLTSVTIPNSVTTIGEGAFRGCTGLTSVTIGNSVTTIGNYAFENCSGLTSVTIPNSVISIGHYAFRSCSGLTSVTIGNFVYEIGEYAFYGCSGLTSVTIGNFVYEIGNWAFYGCYGLTSVTLSGFGNWRYNSSKMLGLSGVISQFKTLNIGSGITSLGGFGFAPDVVNCYAENPPTCSSNTFSNYDGVLHVPTNSMADYFLADYWSNFNNINNDITDKLTLDQSEAALVQWQELQLSATVNPADSEIIWSSSNEKVATVSDNGLVTAMGSGSCYIYATLADNAAVYARSLIASSYPEITLALNENSLEMSEIGGQATLEAIITPGNTGLSASWRSTDEGVATVNDNGVVTATGNGECDIVATVLDKTATCHVTVTVSSMATITLDNDSVTLKPNGVMTMGIAITGDIAATYTAESSDQDVVVARIANGKLMIAARGGITNEEAVVTVRRTDGEAVSAECVVAVIADAGDINCDGVISGADVTALYNELLNGTEAGGNSDVNGDGVVSGADVTALYNLLLN